MTQREEEPPTPVEEGFLFVKHATLTLQQLAASTRQTDAKAAAKFVKALLYLSHAVDGALCSYADSAMQAKDQLRQALIAAVARSFAAAGLQGAQGDAAAACAEAAQRVAAARAMQLSQELQALHTLLGPGPAGPSSGPGGPYCCTAEKLAALMRAVTKLRSLEVDMELHARTAQEVRAQVASSDYSDMNFAYGSTPYSSWHQLLHHPAVSTAAAAAMAPACPGSSSPPRSCMVWGSSLGWLVFFTALTLGWPCVGYELLGSLHCCALDLAVELGMEEGVTFVNADLLSSRLSDVGVLVVTDQCWDQDLMRQAARKIHDELPEGAVVLAYRPWWGEAQRGPCALQPLAQLPLPVSWNDGASMYAFVRRGTGDGHGAGAGGQPREAEGSCAAQAAPEPAAPS